ncbi:MAG: hypothetical protein ACXVZO_04065 [Gaiellaceae bacterium]
MSGTLGRVYSIATALVVFFVAWALVAAKPWVSTKPAADKRLAALDQRQRQLRAESIAVRKLLAHRWNAYKVAYAKREREIAAVRQLWAEYQAAAARAAAVRAAAARTVYSTHTPATTRTTTAGGRTVTTVRTVVRPTGTAPTQPRPATPSSSQAPAAPTQAAAPQPASPPPAPSPPKPPPPPPPPVVSTPPATNTKSS